jgi:hypothetical protein
MAGLRPRHRRVFIEEFEAIVAVTNVFDLDACVSGTPLDHIDFSGQLAIGPTP